jgi:polyhydroxybutyrate depolymerase
VPPRDARPRFRVICVAAPVVLAVGLLLLTACAPRVGVPPVAGTGATRDAAARVHPGLSPACLATTAHPIPERLVVRGQERLVLSHAPAGHAPEPRDLVIAFHGRTNDAARARSYFRLETALPEAVIVYPQALPAGPGTFAWSDPGDPSDALRDFALVDAIIVAVGQARCIDLGRIFVVGHSLGAYFANDVACALGDRVRAVASVAGGLQGGACEDATAALLIHHPQDALVPISAGERARDAFLAANGLGTASATPAADPALTPLGCVRYGRDEVPDPVVWCAHDDATWPGGRYDPHTWPDATPAAMAGFFRRLP